MSSSVMYMSIMYEISIRCILGDKTQRTDIIDLYFTKSPTMEQIMEATRHYLTDMNVHRHIGLDIMGKLKSIKGTAPQPEDCIDGDNITIYNSKVYLFRQEEEDGD